VKKVVLAAVMTIIMNTDIIMVMNITMNMGKVAAADVTIMDTIMLKMCSPAGA
jgi:hypothetical protein